ncbi:beta-1,3-galactosyltransferase pvg3-like [Canna indica]|uniref:Hexosyltransferase n=1 Tax=Canna indica TaxID=4628 RepID=A0AAQ3L2V6_9LILI|nr:beta-1,3-galactosyltransferase pvg3-like [Canna indica]
MNSSSHSKIVSFILLTSAMVVLLFFFMRPNEFRLRSMSTSSPSSLTSFMAPVTPKPDFRLLIGVLTVPDSYERRHLVRHAYALQSNLAGPSQIDIRFVFCNLTNEEQRVLIAMEILLYDDIIILNCTENMNDGKTYTYFSSVRHKFDENPYDYVMKTDDDAYFRLDKLGESLRGLPREDVYYGFGTPCDKPGAQWRYMSGMGYILSWDLVEWIASSEKAREHRVGIEDLTTGSWLREGGRGRNWFDMRPAMYDYPDGPPLCYRHELVADTIGVHKLKTNLKWARTLKYFNVTAGLKPSKLYHID